MFQTKEQNKTPGGGKCHEVDVIYFIVFKVIIIRMLTKLRRIENFNKELENIRKNQSELYNTISEVKNKSLKEINSGIDNVEE